MHLSAELAQCATLSGKGRMPHSARSRLKGYLVDRGEMVVFDGSALQGGVYGQPPLAPQAADNMSCGSGCGTDMEGQAVVDGSEIGVEAQVLGSGGMNIRVDGVKTSSFTAEAAGVLGPDGKLFRPCRGGRGGGLQHPPLVRQ